MTRLTVFDAMSSISDSRVPDVTPFFKDLTAHCSRATNYKPRIVGLGTTYVGPLVRQLLIKTHSQELP